LILAVQSDEKKIISKLCAIPTIQVNDKNLKGETALLWAADTGNLEVVKALIAANAKVDQAMNGTTPLCMAAYNGHLDIVNALIKANAKVDQVTNIGAIPLFVAAYRGHLEIVNVLLLAKADVKVMFYGKTPLDIAREKGCQPIVDLLTEFNQFENVVNELKKAIHPYQENQNIKNSIDSINLIIENAYLVFSEKKKSNTAIQYLKDNCREVIAFSDVEFSKILINPSLSFFTKKSLKTELELIVGKVGNEPAQKSDSVLKK
ncbi:MAG TPA: ankyrin repeat domain-containing protein, partial [Gammaproteobacteria bacterium]|nr:ankyrin repeat domain-containing protein [Gammaproteobacteria bacterium]